jgi:hypothetical protein
MGRLHISFSAVDMSTDDEYHSVAVLLERPVPWKIAAAMLALLLLGESGCIFLARHEPIDRFKPMDEDNYLAFDSATG